MDNPEQLTMKELYENEKRRRQKAEDVAETERHRRLKAEKFAEELMEVNRPTTIPELLAQYYAKSLTVKVGADGLARGVVSNPVGRKYPKLITPWRNFASDHQEIWETIRASSTYSNQLFDSSSTIKAIMLQDIRSELDLVLIDNLIVLKPVKAILNRLSEEEEVRKLLKLQGNVEFRRLLGLSTMSKSNQIPPSSSPVTPTNREGKGATRDATKAPRHPKDVGAQADAFFMTDRHGYSIEYKLLFKLFTAAEIVPGLHGDIFPEQEVINNNDTSPEATSRRLVTVVITQLYFCLLKAHICLGYISTGDMIIFLHVLDNPGHVEYHVWNPRDFDFSHSACIHNTAIAEVVTFSIRAMQAPLQALEWNDAARKLEIWPQECDQLPDNTPRTNREESTEPDMPVYKPGREADLFSRSSPVKTRQLSRSKASKGGKKKDQPESPSLRKGKLGCRPKDIRVTKKGGGFRRWEKWKTFY